MRIGLGWVVVVGEDEVVVGREDEVVVAVVVAAAAVPRTTLKSHRHKHVYGPGYMALLDDGRKDAWIRRNGEGK